MIDRRHVLGLTAAGVVLLWSAEDAAACTIAVQDRTTFSDRRSRAAIAEFVALLNEAPTLSEGELIRRLDEMSVVLEDDWVDERVGDRAPGHVGRDYLFVKEFRLSGGKLDSRPIEVEETNLLRRLGNRATYQLATLSANRLRTVRRFPEWYLED